ncbi:MAG: hypothetical protein JXA10_02890, partial [Anaerolineae bacterium]|nr:hypothetical protein [Anaerolineae bacterium]
DKIFDDIEFFARYGFNKCLIGDTEIIDAETGRRVRIGDLADGMATIEHTITLDTDTMELRSGPVTHVMENGVKPVYKLTTQLGREITATANHPFYTFDGWRLLEELSEGDQIAVPRLIPVEGSREWSEDQITSVVEALDLRDPDAGLSDDVFELTNANIAVLLARLIERCKSSLYRATNNLFVTFLVKPERLVQQIQHLLLRFGIVCRVGEYQQENPPFWWAESSALVTYHIFEIDDVASQYTFADQIGIHFSDDENRIKMTAFAASTPPLHSVERGLGGEVNRANAGRTHWSAPTNPDHVPDSPSPFLERGPGGEVGDIYWDRVISIEYAGEEMTYDLTVPDTHNFVANDIIVHNSHAADYAVLTCQTAFLKCHYPHEYMAALMSVQRDDSGKVSLFAADCARMGIQVLPPTVNDSLLDFSIQTLDDGERAIRFGLGAVKNVGVGPLEHVLAEREKKGRFTDLDDFCRRVDTRILNKRPMESLIKVGALDDFAERYVLLAALEKIISFSANYHKAKDVGQMSLFGEATGVDFGAEESILGSMHDVTPVPQREMLNWEKDLVGLYVTDHPLKPIMAQLQRAMTHTTAELEELGEAMQDRQVTIAGLVTGLRAFTTKNGDMMAVATIEDITGQMSAVLFPRTWASYKDKVDEDAVVIVRGKADASRGEMQIIVDSVTQDFTYVTAADEDKLAELRNRTFEWETNALPPSFDMGYDSTFDTLRDPASDDEDDIYDEETGEVVSAEPRDDSPTVITEPVGVASAGASANVPAPPIEPAPVQVVASAGQTFTPPPDLIVDREEPVGWDEYDDRFVPIPDWAGDEPLRSTPPSQPAAAPDRPLRDAAGRLTPPPARGARTRDQVVPDQRAHEQVTHDQTERESVNGNGGNGHDQRRESADTRSAPRNPSPFRRTPPPKPAPQPEPEPGRLLTVYIERTGNSERDRRRLQRLHGILIEFPGNDQFRFVIEGGGRKAAVMAFPNHLIHINDEMLDRVATIIGGENVEVGD